MAKLVIIVLAAIILVAIPVVLSLKIGLTLKIVLIVLAASALTFLFYVDHLREQAQLIAKFDSMEHRVEELLKKLNESDFIVEIYGFSVGYGFAHLVVAVIGCFIVVVWGIQGHEILLIAGLIIAALSLARLLFQIASRNKLQLAITRRSFTIKNGPLVDWNEVEDVSLIAASGRTSPYFQVLVFTLIDSLHNRESLPLIPKMLWQIGLKRRIIKTVVLGSNNEEPEVIYRVCKALCTTGRRA